MKIYKQSQPEIKSHINKKSEIILKEKNLNGVESKNTQSKNSQFKTSATSPKELKKTNGFSSTVISEEYYDQQVKKFLDSKQQKLEKLRQQKAAKELDGFTGKPETNKSKQVDSKLGIELRTSEYIEQLKEKENVKKQYQDLVQKRRELRDTIECTHKPQITPLPTYLKESAQKTKMGYSQPPKQKPTSYQTLHTKNKPEPLRLSYSSHRQEEVPSLFDDSEQQNSEQEINLNEMYFSPSQHQLTTQSPEITKRKQFTPQLAENKENFTLNFRENDANPAPFG